MTGLATENTLVRDVADVEAFARRCFSGSPGDLLGVELEFLVFDRTAPARQVPIARIADALPPLPGGSVVTFEPGGQLELSGPPGPLPGAIARLTSDVEAVREALREVGLVLAGVGLDPLRPAWRQLRLPRYEAMAEFLGAPYGALMMCSTASIQVNLDLGPDPAVRWERAHLLGPVLVAAFACSPLSGSRPCGWMSGRQAVWERLDPTRTAAVPTTGDPADAWAEYLLDARVMAVREPSEREVPGADGNGSGNGSRERNGSRGGNGSREENGQRDGNGRHGGSGPGGARRRGNAAHDPDAHGRDAHDGGGHSRDVHGRGDHDRGGPNGHGGHLPGGVGDHADGVRYRTVRDGSTFRDLLATSRRPPTLEDLAYHATTLFPPVRPRGWLEIRYLDAQDPAGWQVCAAVTHALVTDDRAADAALAAAEPCAGVAGMWPRAGRRGLAEPRLRDAADGCFRAALEALPRLGASPELVRDVAAFADRHVSPGRSPAVDLLELVRGPEGRLPAWLAGEGRA
ncbi:glutamate-cysteine ligase family protein [Streptosporangium longisporum]|uniref:Glutamate--cysteine ligase EgtA n=1 Tax=Streptosporangium longisporum TaxID=46187 RepID=A0ABP6LHM6_9ACTN